MGYDILVLYQFLRQKVCKSAIAHRTPKKGLHARTSRTLSRMDFARTRVTALRTCACAHAPSQLIPCKILHQPSLYIRNIDVAYIKDSLYGNNMYSLQKRPDEYSLLCTAMHIFICLCSTQALNAKFSMFDTTLLSYMQIILLSEDFNGKARNDRRCGPEFPLPDGKPSQCDPESANFCCSKWGFCGADAEHCDCPTCFNYKLLGK